MVQADKGTDTFRNRILTIEIEGKLATISPSTFTVDSRDRNIMNIDFDWSTRYSVEDGSIFLFAQNIDTSDDANTIVTSLGPSGQGVGLMKFGLNHADPQMGINFNNEGDWKFYQATDSSFTEGSIEIGFAEAVERSDFSLTGWINRNPCIRIDNSVADIPFLNTLHHDTKLTMFYGEMSQNNGVATPNVITINTIGVFETVTGMSAGLNNGFTVVGDALKCVVPGVYDFKHKTDWTDGTATLYEFMLHLNGSPVSKTSGVGRKGNANDIVNAMGYGKIQLAKDDLVLLKVANHTTTTNPDVINSIVETQRIGG